MIIINQNALAPPTTGRAGHVTYSEFIEINDLNFLITLTWLLTNLHIELNHDTPPVSHTLNLMKRLISKKHHMAGHTFPLLR